MFNFSILATYKHLFAYGDKSLRYQPHPAVCQNRCTFEPGTSEPFLFNLLPVVNAQSGSGGLLLVHFSG
jgi:hypothetical protein